MRCGSRGDAAPSRAPRVHAAATRARPRARPRAPVARACERSLRCGSGGANRARLRGDSPNTTTKRWSFVRRFARNWDASEGVRCPIQKTGSASPESFFRIGLGHLSDCACRSGLPGSKVASRVQGRIRPRTAHARALSRIEPSDWIGSRRRRRSRSSPRLSSSRDAAYAGAGPCPPRKGAQ
jgi:hypothetical protein